MDTRDLVLAAALAAVPFTASAGLAIGDVQKPMLVTRVDCTVVIDKAGHVAEYRPRTEMPAPIADRVRDMVRAIEFVPVEQDGHVVNAQVDMRVVVTATEMEDGGMRLALENLVFPNEAPDGDGAPTKQGVITNRVLPAYPTAVLMAQAEADQLAVLRFDASGNVIDAAIEQAALVRGRARPADTVRILDMLERSALTALRKWTIDPASMPDDARLDDGFVAYVPVKWRLSANPRRPEADAKPGEWTLETRTTRHVPGWIPVVDQALQPGVADLADGQIGGLNRRYRLAAPLGAADS